MKYLYKIFDWVIVTLSNTFLMTLLFVGLVYLGFTLLVLIGTSLNGNELPLLSDFIRSDFSFAILINSFLMVSPLCLLLGLFSYPRSLISNADETI